MNGGLQIFTETWSIWDWLFDLIGHKSSEHPTSVPRWEFARLRQAGLRASELVALACDQDSAIHSRFQVSGIGTISTMERNLPARKKASTCLQRLPPSWPKSGWENRGRRQAGIFLPHESYGRKRRQVYTCVRKQAPSESLGPGILYPRETDSLVNVKKNKTVENRT